MLRVLHVISSLDPKSGGPLAALVGLARAQASAGLSVSVLATWLEGQNLEAADELRRQGVNVRMVGPCRGPLRRHPEIINAASEMVGSTDIVHIHALWEEVQHQAARAAQRAHIPYIIRPCGMLDGWSLAQSRWRKKAYMLWRLNKNLRRSKALHFTTQQERNLSAAAAGGVPAIIEPNGVNLAEFEDLPPRGQFRASHGIAPDRPVIVFLGRIHPGKGLEYLIPALAAVKTPDALLVVVGPDSAGYQAEMQTLADGHGLNGRVLFTGLLKGRDRISALADSDLFALPSDHENFGIAVVEALAAGLPVVISDQVSIFREICAARVGAAVKREKEVLAAELTRWLADNKMRASAAALARPFVWDHYNWDRIARRWADHYTRCIKRD